MTKVYLKRALVVALLCIGGGSLIPALAADDVTSKLNDASLTDETKNWALTSNGGNHKYNSDNGYHESWNNTFSLSQTISGLDAGYYQVSIQAVSSGETTTFKLTATSGDNSATPALIKNRTHSTFIDMAAWWKADASQDLNRIYATVKVEEGKNLVVGVSQTNKEQWVVYGQFKLSKLTDDEGKYAVELEKVTNPLTTWTVTGNTGMYKDRYERYNVKMYTGDVIAYTINGLPNGKYEVEFNGAASYTSGRGFEGKTGDNLTCAFANSGEKVSVPVVERTEVGNSDFNTITVNGDVTEGTLKTGLTNVAEGGNWFVLSLNKITYLGPITDLTEYQKTLAKAVANAQAVKEGTIPTAAYTALTNTISQYNKEYTTTADYETAIKAIKDATAAATALQSDYAAYKAMKTNVQTLEATEGYTDNNGAKTTLDDAITTQDKAVEAATTSEAITTATTALRSAALTFVGNVTPSTSNPFNITFLITNPGFDTDASGWTYTVTPGLSYSDCEYYQTDFDINQTLTGLPAGNYELKVQAFQRTGTNADAYSQYTNGTNNVNAVIYINNGSQKIKHWASEPSTSALSNEGTGDWMNDYKAAEGVYLPNSMAGARVHFDTGAYENSVLVNVSDGTLKFGFKGNQTGKSYWWTIFDNFRLYYYGNAVAVTLSENKDFSAVSDIENATVTLTRTFNANAWNTLVLPFDLSADEVSSVLGSNAKVATYTGTTQNSDGTYSLNFENATAITANVPVFVYGANDVTAKEISGKTIKAGTPSSTPDGAAFTFQGSYSSSTPVSDGSFFISSDNNFYKANGSEKMKGLRAVFVPTTEESASAKGLKMNISGTVTGINGVAVEKAFDEPIYNIAGQKVTKNYKGLVIKNGKKYVNK